MAGRRPKMSGPRLQVLLDALRLGNTRRASFTAAGIGSATFYRMLEDGAFREAVEKAEADAEVRYAALVARASEMPNTWQAAAWWLERRRPDDYGRRDRVDVTVDVRALAEKIAGDLSPEEVMAEADRILAEGK